MKLHVGNGCVYLAGYVNVDLPGASVRADENPKGVQKWRTTVDDYYGRVKVTEKSLRGGESPDHQDLVCDEYGSWSHLPFPDGSCEEILSVQCFEHLSKTEAPQALMEARRVLKDDGILRLDVPDHEATLAKYRETGDEFMLRHLLGSRKNDFAFHMGSWAKQKLIEFCQAFGFELVKECPNIHCYPAFCCEFKKLPMPELDVRVDLWKAAWEYCGDPLGTPLQVPDNWNVLELGPGRNPWQRANRYVDANIETVGLLKHQGLSALCADVCLLPPTWDKEFDFVLTCHMMEHVPDPVKAASEISRVGKSGVVVCPSPSKDVLFAAHEPDHKWFVHAGKDRMFFIPIPEGWHEHIYDVAVSGEMHRIWRYGEPRLEGVGRDMRKWFRQTEPHLDTVFRWKDGLKVEVLE